MTEPNSKFEKVLLIINPKSRRGLPVGHKLKKWILNNTDLKVTERHTDYAGHAHDIIRDAHVDDKTVIISVSGDGGMHECNQGVLHHNTHKEPVIVPWPGGNACDVFHSLYTKKSWKKALIKGRSRRIDFIEVTISGPENTQKYIAQQASVGLVAEAANIFHKNRPLNDFKETWLVFLSYLTNKPVLIEIGGKKEKTANLIVTNIPRVGKYLKYPQCKPDDTYFVMTNTKGNRINLGLEIIKAMTIGLKGKLLRELEFFMPEGGIMQIDGEPRRVPINSKAEIKVLPHYLKVLDWKT